MVQTRASAARSTLHHQTRSQTGSSRISSARSRPNNKQKSAKQPLNARNRTTMLKPPFYKNQNDNPHKNDKDKIKTSPAPSVNFLDSRSSPSSSESEEEMPEHGMVALEQGCRVVVLRHRGHADEPMGLGVISQRQSPLVARKEVTVASVMRRSISDISGLLVREQIVSVAGRVPNDHHDCKILIRDEMSETGVCALVVRKETVRRPRAATPIPSVRKPVESHINKSSRHRHLSKHRSKSRSASAMLPDDVMTVPDDVKRIMTNELRHMQQTHSQMAPRGILKTGPAGLSDSSLSSTDSVSGDDDGDQMAVSAATSQDHSAPSLTWIHKKRPPQIELTIESDLPADVLLKSPDRLKSNNILLRPRKKKTKST